MVTLVLGLAAIGLGAIAIFRADHRFTAAGVICVGVALVLPSIA